MLRNTVKLLTGSVLGQAFTFAITILLARIYSPAEFGVVAVFTATALILNELINLRYDKAILLPKDEADANTLLQLCILVALALTAVVGIVVFITTLQFPELVQPGKAGSLFVWLPLTTLIAGLLNPISAWLNRNKHYSWMAASKLGIALGTGLTSLTLGYLGFGAQGLLYGFIAGQLLGLMILALAIMNKPVNLLSINTAQTNSMAKTYAKFPLYATSSTLLNTFSRQTPFYLLEWFFLSSIVGYFSMTNKMLGAPVLLIAGSFAQVFFQHASDTHSNKPEEFLRLVITTSRNLFLVGLIPIIILAVWGPHIFSFVFGDQWLEAGRYAQYLAPWVLMLFIINPLGNIINIKQNLEFDLVYNILLLTSRVGVLAWFGRSGQPDMAVAGYAAVSFIFSCVYFVYLLKISGLTFANRKLAWSYLWNRQ